ncbi:MAG: 50S ribosomal protein L21 [Pseudolabrys sp.]|nr:50S ribosomal protein L21 [Pseudolabrys sp.]
MFAVIRTGGKQYRVAAQDVIRVDRLEREPGEVIAFEDVLLLGGDPPVIGTPTVAGASVTGTVLRHERGDKVIAFKKRRRKNSRRKRGYRHEFSLVRITEILTGSAQPEASAQARAADPREPASGVGQADRPRT